MKSIFLIFPRRILCHDHFSSQFLYRPFRIRIEPLNDFTGTRTISCPCPDNTRRDLSYIISFFFSVIQQCFLVALASLYPCSILLSSLPTCSTIRLTMAPAIVKSLVFTSLVQSVEY
ncbi:unnamed protein product [Amoebophrya sp. A120]|nr:unnamed protein product [Amoebophrya sp. A120]|eukprot:GSA120T00023395001.1